MKPVIKPVVKQLTFRMLKSLGGGVLILVATHLVFIWAIATAYAQFDGLHELHVGENMDGRGLSAVQLEDDQVAYSFQNIFSSDVYFDGPGAVGIVREVADNAPYNIAYHTLISGVALTSPTSLVYMFNEPHIFYYNMDAFELVHLYRNSGVWQKEVIDGADTAGGFPSAVKCGDEICVTYYDRTNRNLQLARGRTGAWSLETVDPSVDDVGAMSSLTVLPTGRLAVVYYDATYSRLLFATELEADGWQLETVGMSTNWGFWPQIVAANDGTLHVVASYIKVNDSSSSDIALYYAKKVSGGEWSVSSLGYGNHGGHPAIALSEGGNPVIGYRHLMYSALFGSNGFAKTLSLEGDNQIPGPMWSIYGYTVSTYDYHIWMNHWGDARLAFSYSYAQGTSYTLSGPEDSDGDRIPDNREEIYDTASDDADSDDDGLSDGDEVLLYNTNPLAADSDLDGVLDNLDPDPVRSDAGNLLRDGSMESLLTRQWSTIGHPTNIEKSTLPGAVEGARALKVIVQDGTAGVEQRSVSTAPSTRFLLKVKYLRVSGDVVIRVGWGSSNDDVEAAPFVDSSSVGWQTHIRYVESPAGAGDLRLVLLTSGEASFDDSSIVVAPAGADIDADGVLDDADNCMMVANNQQDDLDGDGAGDVCDSDRDGDGVANTLDCAVDNPLQWRNRAFDDGDGDGIRESLVENVVACFGAVSPVGYAASFSDLDNCPLASNQTQLDTDRDGEGDACDADDDNDGKPDVGDCAPLDYRFQSMGEAYVDTDSDWYPDNLTPYQVCAYPESNYYPTGYTATATVDNCPNISNWSQSDADADGLGDDCDAAPNFADSDSDGIGNDEDCAPSDVAKWRALAYPDTDGDGLRDQLELVQVACFGGSVPQGYSLAASAIDNCVNLANAGQEDTDSDGLGDACDAAPNFADSDSDGVGNSEDCAPSDVARWRAVAYPDGDGDGVRDQLELVQIACFGGSVPQGYTVVVSTLDNCVNMSNPDQVDTDGDGLGDACDDAQPGSGGGVVDGGTGGSTGGATGGEGGGDSESGTGGGSESGAGGNTSGEGGSANPNDGDSVDDTDGDSGSDNGGDNVSDNGSDNGSDSGADGDTNGESDGGSNGGNNSESDSGSQNSSSNNSDDDEDGLSYDQEVELGSDPNKSDSDSDGIADGDEVKAQTDLLDRGSGQVVLGKELCSEWNGYYGGRMWNFLEQVNLSKRKLAISATLYNIKGGIESSRRYNLQAGGQFDLAVHGLKGWQEQSYGRICLKHNGEAGALEGRMLYYLPKVSSGEALSPDPQTFAFVLAMPFANGATGEQVVTYNNRLDPPTEGDYVSSVSNWIQLSNTSKKVVRGRLRFHRQDGKVVRTVQVKLAGGSRQDFGTMDVGGESGLVSWLPASGNLPTVMRGVRYYSDAPRSTQAPSTASLADLSGAVQLPGVAPTGEWISVPVDSRRSEETVEIVNCLGKDNVVRLEAYSSKGKRVSARSFVLKRYTTKQVNLQEAKLLPSDMVGVVRIKGSSRNSTAAFLIHFGRKDMAGNRVAYGINAAQPYGKVMRGSYNTFLRQESRLVLANVSNTAVNVQMSISRADGKVYIHSNKPRSVKLGKFQVAEVDLGRYVGRDEYGIVALGASNHRNVIGWVMRRREGDYTVPTLLR